MLFVLPTFLVPGCLSLQPSAGVHVRPALKLQPRRTTELRMETAAAWIAAASMFNQEAAAMPIVIGVTASIALFIPLTSWRAKSTIDNADAPFNGVPLIGNAEDSCTLVDIHGPSHDTPVWICAGDEGIPALWDPSDEYYTDMMA